MNTSIVETPEQHAAVIADAWRSSVEGIFETGRRIIAAKAALPHGEFGRMCETMLPFGCDTAQMLMRISSDSRLQKTEHVRLLPAAWGTLHAITRLPDDVFDRAMSNGTITPDVDRATILKLVRRVENNAEPLQSQSDSHDSFDNIVESGIRFGTVYADPPWLYGNQATRAATSNHYGGMTVDEICDIPVPDVVGENAHLHLWTTNAFLFDAKRVMEAWGFEYKSVFVWVKPQMGIGNYWRVSHEFMLFGLRGKAPFRSRGEMSWGRFDRTRHSAKPTEVRGMIERASPGPYLEMFGRSVVQGWTVWGNQVEGNIFQDGPTQKIQVV